MNIDEIRKLQKHAPKEALEELVALSSQQSVNEVLFDFWLEFASDESIQEALHIDLIWALYDLTDQVNNIPVTNAVALKIIEANLRSIYQDPQTTWETLESALILDPYNEELWYFLETLNEYPEEAPVFEDGVERIAEFVKKGKFPKEQFEQLLLTLADSDNPKKYRLAIKIASGSL